MKVTSALAALACLLLVGLQASAQQHRLATYSYAGLAWGAETATVRETLSQSYSFGQVDKDGDLLFNGKLLGEPVSVAAIMANGKLARVTITIEPDKDLLVRTYNKFKDSLAQKYGSPNSVQDVQISSNKQAIRVLLARWQPAADGSDLAISSENSRAVVIAYDSPAGEQEEKRRSAAKKKDL